MALLPFILRRLVGAGLAVLAVCVLVFLFLHIVPGDPIDNLAGGGSEEVSPEARQEVIECMRLDRPIPAQFVAFLGDIKNGTLGRQCPDPDHKKPPVSARIAEVFPYTIQLALGGMVVALVLALPLGILAAVRRGSIVDALATTTSLGGISIPTMWMGPLLIFLLYVRLGVLPGPAEPNARFALLLPSIVVGTHLMAMLSRMTRSSMLDVLREDYMQTARAKGLSSATVIFKHGLRNALLPVITVAGMQFGALLSGAIITEKVFARPGLGTLLHEAIRQRNYPMIRGCVLVVAVTYVTINLIVDIAYGFADPRIRRG